MVKIINLIYTYTYTYYFLFIRQWPWEWTTDRFRLWFWWGFTARTGCVWSLQFYGTIRKRPDWPWRISMDCTNSIFSYRRLYWSFRLQWRLNQFKIRTGARWLHENAYQILYSRTVSHYKLLNIDWSNPVVHTAFVYRSFVRLGDWNTSSLIDCVNDECADPPVDIPIESAVSRYILQKPWVSNIGLLRLKMHVVYTKWISPICLPTAKHLVNIDSYVGGNFVISGFNQMVCKYIVQS